MPGFIRSAVFQPMPTVMSCWTGSVNSKKPRRVFVMHGEEETALGFANYSRTIEPRCLRTRNDGGDTNIEMIATAVLISCQNNTTESIIKYGVHGIPHLSELS